ncbi:hypothetical protein ZWY2020_025298 [Hordeum vulgare]|nr:hypothetical protein ZWY2020_025298 [Hordeum vulgare]
MNLHSDYRRKGNVARFLVHGRAASSRSCVDNYPHVGLASRDRIQPHNPYLSGTICLLTHVCICVASIPMTKNRIDIGGLRRLGKRRRRIARARGRPKVELTSSLIKDGQGFTAIGKSTYHRRSRIGPPCYTCHHCGAFFWWDEHVDKRSSWKKRHVIYNRCCSGGLCSWLISLCLVRIIHNCNEGIRAIHALLIFRNVCINRNINFQLYSGQ